MVFRKVSPFQVNKSELTDRNARKCWNLLASRFLSATTGVIVVKAIKGN